MNSSSQLRENLDFRDLENLSKNLEHSYYKDLLKGELFFSRYSMDRNLKNYANLPLNYKIHALFEHGILFTEYVGGAFRVHEYLPSIVASRYRVNVLKSQKNYKGAYTIGPYIHYVNSLLSKNKLKEEKERLGRNLLVFPSHSIENVTSKFDYVDFINFIKIHAQDYDSVRICMYFHDVTLKRHIPYQKEGFEIVTAGHYNDYNFLPRLRSIIETSDMTMSNNASTHLGYCIYLNKPHFLLKSKINYDVSNNNILKKNNKEAVDKIKSSNNLSKIIELFSDFNETITKEQYELISYLWGFDEVKTPKELQDLIYKINENYSWIKYYLSCVNRFKSFALIKMDGTD